MEDIIWYLHKFVDGKIYTILNKKCRDIYFTNHGLFIKNYSIIPRKYYGNNENNKNIILLKYRINLDIVASTITCIPDLNYTGEIYEKILSNIDGCNVVNLKKSTLKLIKTIPNIRKLSGMIGFDDIDSLKELSEIPNTTPKKLIYWIKSSYDNYPEMREVLIKLNPYICCNTEESVKPFSDIINRLDGNVYNSQAIYFPELLNFYNLFDPPNFLNITAPKLKSIYINSIHSAYIMAKKCKTITKIRGVFKYENTEKFIEAYTYLKDHKFILDARSVSFAFHKHPEDTENLENLINLLKLPITSKFIREIYIYRAAQIPPKILENISKIFRIVLLTHL